MIGRLAIVIASSAFGTLFKSLISGMSGRIVPIIAAVSLSLGAIGGWWLKTQFVDAAQKREYAKALQVQKENAKKERARLEAARKADEVAIAELNDQLAKAQRLVKTIYVEVPIYAEDISSNPRCNVPVGIIERVLNPARQGQLPSTAETASRATEEGQAPSTITAGAEYQYHAECAVAYNQLKAQHDALVDWINAANGEEVP